MELLKRLTQMERAMANGPAVDSAGLFSRIERVEKNIASGNNTAGMDTNVMIKMLEMEKELKRTQQALEEERKAANEFMALAAAEGGNKAPIDPIKLLEVLISIFILHFYYKLIFNFR